MTLSHTADGMSEAKATFRSVLWNHTGKTLEYVFIYVTSVLIARTLGVRDNGTFAGLLSLSQLLLVLVSAGLETSLNKHIPQLGSNQPLEETRFILRRFLLIRTSSFLVLAVAVVIGSGYISLPRGAILREYLWVLLFYALFRSLVPLLAMVLTAQFKTGLTAKINLTMRAVELLVVALLSRQGTSISMLLLVFTASSIIQILGYFYFARNNLFGEEQHTTLSPLLTFGFIFWANTGADYFLGRHGDVLFLSTLLPESSQASVYDVAYSLLQMATLGLTIGFSGVTFATFARLAVTSRETMDRFYGFLIRITSLLTLPLYAFVLFNARPLVTLVYSSNYGSAALLLQGMAAFRLVARLFGGGENAEYLLSVGRVGSLVGIGILAALLNIGLDILLIPSFGALGAVIASGIANLIVNMLGGILVYRASRARPQFAFWASASFAFLLASWLSSILFSSETTVNVVGCCVAFTLLALVSLVVVKPLVSEDLRWLAASDQRLSAPLHFFVRNRVGSAVV